MKKPKLAIIGKGTAGSINAGYFSTRQNVEIDWYYDPSQPEQSVGEGTTLGFPLFLAKNLNISHADLISNLDGTYKTGIRKINYNGKGDFIHEFNLGSSGLHFNATKLQNFILENYSKNINLIPQKIETLDNIDATHIIDCSGRPKNYDEHIMASSIPVNSTHIIQCEWNKPEFTHTLTIARPYGWVFGVPLQNRCSVGYLYNNNINTLDEVKEDIKEVFKQFNLTPTSKSNSFNFNNYYRKENFTDRVSYNGNASFFLEPIEATSISTILNILKKTNQLILNKKFKETLNTEYVADMVEIEQMITLHYYAGSIFNTPFWEYAYNHSLSNIDKMSSNPKFKRTLNEALDNISKNVSPQLTNFTNYGTWGSYSFYQNLKNLGLMDKINNLVNKN